MDNDWIVGTDDTVLVTGSTGFIGLKVVETLLQFGFRRLRCFVRPSSNIAMMENIVNKSNHISLDIIEGDLTSRDDCLRATKDVAIIFHLAALSSRSFPAVYFANVVGTRNLLEAAQKNSNLRRFLNVSSFAVYSNQEIPRGGVLDENCKIDDEHEKRYDAYAYGKIKQDELLLEYNRRYKIPYAIVRPGAVYGPGKVGITGRMGVDTFGIFLHLGRRNIMPFTFVDNCAEAVVLAGIKKGIEGEVFNIVDDELPTSKSFLGMYKKNVKALVSLSIPYWLTYWLCFLWEKYSKWSCGQIPPVFNRRRCIIEWRGNRYTNEKAKTLLGWHPKIGFEEAARRYFDYQLSKTGGK